MTKNTVALLGIDIGSTTAKVVLEQKGKITYQCYERHFSQVRVKTLEILSRLREMIGESEINASDLFKRT